MICDPPLETTPVKYCPHCRFELPEMVGAYKSPDCAMYECVWCHLYFFILWIPQEK